MALCYDNKLKTLIFDKYTLKIIWGRKFENWEC